MAGLSLWADIRADDATIAGQPRRLPPGSRIVFCGDSITGQGGGWIDAGFCFQMEWALEKQHPGASYTLVPLGGSGHGVASWTGLERDSRTAEVMLDVKSVGVKASLDRPADVLVVMLGMNDVLAPYVGADDAALDRWIGGYRQLVTSLQERTRPRVTAICTITMYTEDPASFKNRMIGRMNERLHGLAKDLGAVLLPTGEACWEVQSLGRQRDPAFHVTTDMIHLNHLGNQAVAVGMLRGLGEDEAARLLLEERIRPALARLTAGDLGISYEVTPQAEPDAFLIRTWCMADGKDPAEPPVVRLVPPQGWTVTPDECTGCSGVFTAKGPADRWNTMLRVQAHAGTTSHTRDIAIAAPWLVAAGLVQPWKQSPALAFDPETAVTPIDRVIEAGGDFTGAIDLGKGQTLRWQRLHPSVNLTGGADPASIDYAAVTNGENFEGGYATRRIRSERERPVKLVLSTSGLAARLFLTVWLNGRMLYQHDLTDDPRYKTARQVTIDAVLRAGDNTLVIKSNHCTWQWQFAAALRGEGGDDLADLRYDTHVADRARE